MNVVIEFHDVEQIVTVKANNVTIEYTVELLYEYRSIVIDGVVLVRFYYSGEGERFLTTSVNSYVRNVDTNVYHYTANDNPTISIL